MCVRSARYRHAFSPYTFRATRLAYPRVLHYACIPRVLTLRRVLRVSGRPRLPSSGLGKRVYRLPDFACTTSKPLFEMRAFDKSLHSPVLRATNLEKLALNREEKVLYVLMGNGETAAINGRKLSVITFLQFLDSTVWRVTCCY